MIQYKYNKRKRKIKILQENKTIHWKSQKFRSQQKEPKT